jgi:autotransporter-associated beta strand protein
MTNRSSKAYSLTSLAVLLVGAVLCESMARAATWQITAAGTSYSWIGANWDGAYPNAPGATANFSIALGGDQTVNLNRAITIGTLNAGDANGTSTLTIGSGTGGYPLVFQGTTAGAATAINYVPSTTPAGAGLKLSSGISLGGTSPLTMTLHDVGSSYLATSSSVALGGNTFTVTGDIKADFNPGVITGNGTFVVKAPGVNAADGGGIGVTLDHDQPNFTGTLSVIGGHLQIVSANLPAVSRINISGAFQQSDKYPLGGWLQIGDAGWPAVTTLPDRLNHNAVMAFNGGGYLEYRGQCLSSSLVGQPVVEQVKQIQFNGGLNEIRLLNGKRNSDGTYVSSSTTLLANDPANACIRNPGATLFIGGDDNHPYAAAVGFLEKLRFASGMSKFMIGGGGAAGSTDISIIPWMTTGTLYHPNQGMITYDDTNGIRTLTDAEYYTGTVYGCPPTSNVMDSSLNLGANHTQTINAYITSGWSNQDIGPGSTLTITSGYLSFRQSPGSIGNGTPANAGTINFGPAEGIIWADSFPADAAHPNVIGSVITGTSGLTKTGTGLLILKGANTYVGGTYLNAGVTQLGDGTLTTSKLGGGNVEVSAGATLLIKANVASAIDNNANITLDNVGDNFYGMLSLESGVNVTVHGLILNGTGMPAGTYGSSTSAATYKLDNYFAGPGILTVTAAVPEPATLTLLGTAGLFLLFLARRRRCPWSSVTAAGSRRRCSK